MMLKNQTVKFEYVKAEKVSHTLVYFVETREMCQKHVLKEFCDSNGHIHNEVLEDEDCRNGNCTCLVDIICHDEDFEHKLWMKQLKQNGKISIKVINPDSCSQNLCPSENYCQNGESNRNPCTVIGDCFEDEFCICHISVKCNKSRQRLEIEDEKLSLQSDEKNDQFNSRRYKSHDIQSYVYNYVTRFI